MKKFLTVLFLGLFVAVATPVLHADEAAPAAAGEKAETPKKHKKHKAKKHKAKKAKAAEAPAADAAAK